MLLKLPNVFSPEEVAEIRRGLAQIPYAEQQKARHGDGAGSGLIKNNLQIPPGHPEARPFAETISQRLLTHPELNAFALPRKLHLMFNRYDAGMYYEAHVDAALMAHGKGGTQRNDLSFTVFLSEAEEYQGGDFVAQMPFGEVRLREPAGTVIVYQADTLHGVEAVTEGARWAVVGWIESLIADPVERQIHYDLAMLMQDVLPGLDAPTRRRFEGLRENLVRRWIQT